ncbi:MAG: adenylyltransferase/cytidyltransferase family protein [Gammaproteobacteria bacterium]|nr:glycerol-3-phosphate cytidylyltransferase [Gammaproteobacteria bacterium]MBQ08247.1 glycerol-3-phosphate cytidylyltransferase [Gammaproteobacteria bacterium]MDP6147416.1 adenylyltransferase/cytidyltransferase family protein [Gammaproteobacteria bacterium]HJL80395.1 adenylyltransferase/cytidyltransferase family protein [Gammaproteobacteria bacterium]HJN01212.1 adenylyltransferase/cytidyltransferase family protein [Gammaproteobacteria bacterium]
MSKVGVIAGNFDVIHPGYIYMFDECKNHCDTLLLLLHEDPSIERPEKIQPILSLEERNLILSSLKQIDRIISYQTESDLYEILNETKIDIRFLGDDYKDKSYTGDDLRLPIHYLDRSHGWSTTKFKKLIAESL